MIMKTTIFCKPTDKGIHSFYLRINSEEYYLFSQHFRRGVQEYYGRGVPLVQACNYSKSRNNTSIIKTMDKLPMYIKYIEKEYDIVVLEQTKKKLKRFKKVS